MLSGLKRTITRIRFKSPVEEEHLLAFGLLPTCSGLSLGVVNSLAPPSVSTSNGPSELPVGRKLSGNRSGLVGDVGEVDPTEWPPRGGYQH